MPSPSTLPPISLPRQIAHDVPLTKRSTKPASPSSDSGRRASSRDGGNGGEGKGSGKSHAHVAAWSTTRGASVPRLSSCRRWRNRSLLEKAGREEDDVPLVSFLPSSVSLAKRLSPLAVVSRVTGLSGLVKRRDQEESRERKREREIVTRLWLRNSVKKKLTKCK